MADAHSRKSYCSNLMVRSEQPELCDELEKMVRREQPELCDELEKMKLEIFDQG